MAAYLPKQVAFTEQPTDTQPTRVSQLLQFLVVYSNVGESVVSYGTGRETTKQWSAARDEEGRQVGRCVRQGPIVLDLIFQGSQLLHDLFALFCPLGVVALGGGSIGIVDGLRLEGGDIASGQRRHS